MVIKGFSEGANLSKNVDLSRGDKVQCLVAGRHITGVFKEEPEANITGPRAGEKGRNSTRRQPGPVALRILQTRRKVDFILHMARDLQRVLSRGMTCTCFCFIRSPLAALWRIGQESGRQGRGADRHGFSRRENAKK